MSYSGTPAGFSCQDGSAVDDLVLGSVNAPYMRHIDAAALSQALARADLDLWLVHVTTFFTDVAPHLVLRFADHHGISRAELTKTYLLVKGRTGECHPALEADLGVLGPAAP